MRVYYGLGAWMESSIFAYICTKQLYAIRYNEIRCILIKKFPYLVHFFINEDTQTVEVLAIISTDRNPKIWEEKRLIPWQLRD